MSELPDGDYGAQQPGPIRLELLGGVRITDRHGNTWCLSGLGAAVAATLALNRDVVSTERLIDTLWWEVPDSGRNALQRHVCRVRRIFRCAGVPDAIQTQGRTGYRLNRSDIWVDVDHLESSNQQPNPDSSQDFQPRWWLEPLAGLDIDALLPVRYELEQQCAAIAAAESLPNQDVPAGVHNALKQWLASSPEMPGDEEQVRQWLSKKSLLRRHALSRYEALSA